MQCAGMESDISEKILGVRSWQRGEMRAPHKPLLLLYAFAKLLAGQRQIVFAEAESDLRDLLDDFGPPRRNNRAEYPFWRLQKDHVWQVDLLSPVQENQSGDVGRKALIHAGAKGFFTADLINYFHKKPEAIKDLVVKILTANFPETIHEDILQAVGIDMEEMGEAAGREKRCPKFREKILQAYEYRCAVCGFDLRMGHTPVALEAAHIKWHQAGGPDEEVNGLALCALHHKLFDRGAFTLSNKLDVLVSDKANGLVSLVPWLLQYHGKKLHFPQSTRYIPQNEYLVWHTREVFQGECRDF